MMDTIRLTIEGTPQAQQRHRTIRMGNSMRNYDPCARDKQAFAESVRRQLPENTAYPVWGTGIPLVLIAKFYLPVPKSYSKRKHMDCVQDLIKPLAHGDVDNHLKKIMDALNSIIYHDDKQVVSVRAEKFYSDRPRTEIIVQRVGI